MKYLTAVFIAVLFTFTSIAQLSKNEAKLLRGYEDSLKVNALKIIQGINSIDRLTADSLFTRTFVRALKVPHSFNYRFDSLETISQLYAPDSTFRIFTWQLIINENVVRQHGAIQMKTKDGSLKLFPLIDKSDATAKIADTIGNHLGWMGAVYYKIIQKADRGNNYYTLLGYDANNIRSNKKIIEVMQFKDGQPLFGGRFFNTADNSLVPKSIARYVMEFKKEASPRLTYDADLDMIIMEHMISESNEPNKKWTLIGDGDYEGFVWKDGKWNYITKVFDQITPENQPPTPNLIRDAAGNIDETKLVGYEKEDSPPAKKPAKKDE